MKVNHTSIFMGDTTGRERLENSNQDKQQKKSSGTLFAGDLGVKPDSILLKRQQARKAAMKVMMDAHENEAKIDDDLKERKNKIKELQTSSAAANKEMNEYKKLMEQAKVDYGIADDSQEQQDLELLIKYKAAKKPGSDVSLTEDEWERLANMGPATEYQEKALALNESMDAFRDEIEDNKKQIMEETEASKSIRQERLKSHAMVDAVNAKDEMILAAAKEEIGMLIDEAKEHLDEEQAKREEEAKKKEEAEKEKEELLEKAKENREEVENRIEQTKEEHATEIAHAVQETQESGTEELQDVQVLDQNQVKISAELKNIIKNENLLDEDLLGLIVDEKN